MRFMVSEIYRDIGTCRSAIMYKRKKTANEVAAVRAKLASDEASENTHVSMAVAVAWAPGTSKTCLVSPALW